MRRLALVLVLAASLGCVSVAVQQVASRNCQAGVPHGPYSLRVVGGPTTIEGAFVNGEKHGIFSFFTTGGTKVAQIPYERDQKQGTIRLSYGEFQFREAAGRLKVLAQYSGNLPNGTKESWWPSGEKRTEESFVDGSLVDARAWAESGDALSRSQALQLSKRGAEADAKLYKILESEVDAYPPDCAEPAAAI